MTIKGLPLVGDLIEGLSGKIGLGGVVLAGRFEGGFDVFDWGLDCLLDSFECVQNVEPEIVSDGFCEHLIFN